MIRGLMLGSESGFRVRARPVQQRLLGGSRASPGLRLCSSRPLSPVTFCRRCARHSAAVAGVPRPGARVRVRDSRGAGP
jgi:hypothetical protein